MREITIVLLSSPLTIALGACKNVIPWAENGEPALIWFGAEANFERFNDPDSIDHYPTEIKSLGFTRVIVDVHPVTGEVLFDTEFAPKMHEWHGYERKNFDYLGHFIRKAHELGIEVHALLSVFVTGHNCFDRGLVYSTHPEWASTVYTPEGITSVANERKKYSAMVNPVNEEFQIHILNVLKDLMKRYPDPDRLMLDRIRYGGITADFSDLSRQKFEAYIGQKVEKFPEDILEWKKDENDRYYPKRGKHFLKWIEWHTENIYDFMARARNEVKKMNPDISFGTYAEAWYPSYYEVGVSLASRRYDPSRDFGWAISKYKNYGYAELMGLYATGNYYTDITIGESLKNRKGVWNETDSQAQSGTWYSVEGFCQKLRDIIKDNKFTGDVLVGQFYDNPVRLSAAIEMNLKASDGLMVFDIVHVINKRLWKEVENGMRVGGTLKQSRKNTL